MTQKQIKFGRPRRAKQAMEDYGCEYRRPMLESFDDLNRMAKQSSRARLISQLVGQDEYPKEFTSYFHGPSRNIEPSYSVTSHTEQFNKKKFPVIPTYPSLVQALRWCPYVETSDEDIKVTEDNISKCKCANCAMKNCYNKVYTKSVGFRDNIMTFNDQCTMTTKLRDASCACAQKASAASEVSICVSDVAVKDTQVPFRPLYASQKCSPIPILKKSYKDFGINHACSQGFDYQEEVVRDVGSSVDIKPKKVRSIKSFLKLRPKVYGSSRHEICPRVNIYNEGISDSIANHLPATPKTIPPPVNVKTERSRIVVKAPSFTDTEAYIPYSHRFDSKYHDSCKKSQGREYHDADSDDARNPAAGPVVVRKAWKPVRVHRGPPQCIKLPRKVLMSERDIETYISKGKPKLPSKNR